MIKAISRIRNKSWFPFLIWLLLVAAFFYPAVLLGKVLAPLDLLDCLIPPFADKDLTLIKNQFVSDAIYQYLPYHWSIAKSLLEDGYMGWNPYCAGGMSIAENTMLCPGDWHHYLCFFMPEWDSWNAGIIIQFFLAGAGMLVLLKNRGINGSPMILGAVSYGFYSQFVLWLYHRWVLGAMCWGPWIVWALLRARKGERLIDLPSILFIALAFRGGHLQSCVFVVLLVMVVWVADWWVNRQGKWDWAYLWKSSFLYALSGFFAALLSFDVFIETVPSYLIGGKGMPTFNFFEILASLPGYASMLVPTIWGTPESMDAMKVFSGDLFDVKYAGGLAFVLACVACFNREAPKTAKFLMVLGVVFCLTPLHAWLYSRYTCIFGLGLAWLAAWQLMRMPQEPKRNLWKKLLIVWVAVVSLWAVASCFIYAWHDQLYSLIKGFLGNGFNQYFEHRDWYDLRALRFLNDSLVWAPRNAAFLGLLGLGLWLCSRIYKGAAYVRLKSCFIVVFVIAELFIFAQSWLVYADKPGPDGRQLYGTPEFMAKLQKEVDSGSLKVYSRTRGYMQANLPSAYGIRQDWSYETVAPESIFIPGSGDVKSAKDAAKAGISHCLVSPEMKDAVDADWKLIDQNSKFSLYSNPFFKGIYIAHLQDGGEAVLTPFHQTGNRRFLKLPAGTVKLEVLESFSNGWKYKLGDSSWKKPGQTDVYGMEVDLDHPVEDGGAEILLQYAPPWRSVYLILMPVVLIGLVLFSLWRYFRKRKASTNFRQDVV